jgi:putative heme-binding domain-containing protein
MIMRPLFLLYALAALAADDVTLPTTAEDIARGKKLYMGGCTYCHGPTGDGGKGADLSRRELPRAKSDGDLARIIEEGIPGTEMPGAWHMTRREVTQTAAFVRTLSQVDSRAPLAGDAARGRAVYAKQRCANCHTTADGGGGYMGPDLAIIGSRRSASHIRESIVSPEASLAGSFVYTAVTLADGRKIVGELLREETFTVLVRDLAGNNHAISKDKTQEIVKDPKKSPMPSYRDKLSPAELDDLVAYLASLKELR